MKKALFISLDGMTDPLGQSQVLPYLAGLAGKGHRIFLISCEKVERFEAGKQQIEAFCKEKGIIWRPQPYLTRPRGIATWQQVRQMYREAVSIHKEVGLDFTHCRSYVPALVGLRLKRKKGIPFIFDMRGFWVDERVEGGLWDVKKSWYQAAFRFMKRKEKAFMQEAAHIVSLTEKGREIMKDMLKERLAPVSVIPCSVDMELFGEAGGGRREARQELRLRLGIAEDAWVFVYLGSVGSWYLLEEMLGFFQYVKSRNPRAHFLLISQGEAKFILKKAAEIGLSESALSIHAAARQEIPALLQVADIGLFFIKPCFSKQASSPTKLGEMLAMGLPVIANGGVGDLDDFFAKNKVGKLLAAFDEVAFEEVEKVLPVLVNSDPEKIRSVAKAHFSLETAVELYDAIYQGIR